MYRQHRQKEFDAKLKYDEEMADPRKPLDYSIYSTEDEEFSDYELEDKDLYPENKGKTKK